MEHPALHIRRVFRSAPLAQLGQDLVGKRLELGVLPEEIGLVRGQIVHEHGEFVLALPVVAEEMIVLFEVRELTLQEPAVQAALQKKLGTVVKVNPAIAVDKVPEQPEGIVGQRNDLFFEHLSPHSLACRLANDVVGILLGDPLKEGFRGGVPSLPEQVHRGLSDAPMRVREPCEHGPLHLRSP